MAELEKLEEETVELGVLKIPGYPTPCMIHHTAADLLHLKLTCILN